MQLETKANCPLDNFKPCKQLECAWFTKLRGTNPNTGADVDEYGCAIAWMPMLMIENSQQQRSTGAAVESFRNEMTKANQVSQQVLLATMQNPKLIESKS